MTGVEGGASLDVWKRVKYSFYATLVYILLTNPMTYDFTNSIAQGLLTVLRNGHVTIAGYILHSVLFFFTILAIMMFPRQ